MKPTTIVEMARMGGRALKGKAKSEAHRLRLCENLVKARLARASGKVVTPKVIPKPSTAPSPKPKEWKPIPLNAPFGQ